MKNNDDTQKIVLGLVIGGIVGGSLLYLLHSTNNKKKPMLDKIGRAISDLGAMIEESKVEESSEAIEQIEKTIPKGDHALNNALNWIATGINLWQKFKKGN